jgi:hypothetical protein
MKFKKQGHYGNGEEITIRTAIPTDAWLEVYLQIKLEYNCIVRHVLRFVVR